MRQHTNREILRAARQCCRLFGCRLAEVRGATLSELFTDAEKQGAVVFWGFWHSFDLGCVIGNTNTGRCCRFK